MLALESDFNRLNADKRQAEEEYRQRVEANIRMIQSLREEIDDQSALYDQRRQENCDLSIDLDRQQVAISERQAEVKRLKHELKQSCEFDALLVGQKEKVEQELISCRELNRQDLQEIEGHNIAIEAAMRK